MLTFNDVLDDISEVFSVSAYMWVTVDNSVLVHHLGKHLQERSSHPLWRHTQFDQSFDIIDLDAIDKFHGKNLC